MAVSWVGAWRRGEEALISDIAAALLHRNMNVNVLLHEVARGRRRKTDGIV
jgi:hypothetical protein